MNDDIWPDLALKESIKMLRESNHFSIIDIGAHYGETFETIAKNIKSKITYFGLEPDPDTYKIFLESVSKNDNHHVDLKALNLAAGPTSGELDFIKTKADAVSGLLKPQEGLSERVPSGDHEILDIFKVKVTTIDEIIDTEKVSIDLLKVDAEGYDLQCLEGCKKSLENKLIDVIMCETFFVKYRQGQSYFWDIAKFLESYGYLFHNIFGNRNTGQGRLYTANGIWVSPKIAKEKNFL